MKSEKQQLIHELLDGERDARREATLLAGARILRRRRHWRAATRGLAFVLVLAGAGLWFEWTNSPKTSFQTPTRAAASPTPAQPQALTDDQLLALFPDTPVALATLPDGKKLLIFPRAADEQKFVTHL